MSQVDLKIGPKIKAFRRQLGIQANKLAERLNISPSYLALIEGGKRKIDGDLLLRTCQELKIELSDLTTKDVINLANNISELLDDKLFDSAVGLALHEGSHILLSDFDFLKNLEFNIPQEYIDRSVMKGFTKNETLKNVKNLLNYIEDKRIDYFVLIESQFERMNPMS